MTVQPRAAYCFVNSRPMPEFAPVISTVSAFATAGTIDSSSTRTAAMRANGRRSHISISLESGRIIEVEVQRGRALPCSPDEAQPPHGGTPSRSPRNRRRPAADRPKRVAGNVLAAVIAGAVIAAALQAAAAAAGQPVPRNDENSRLAHTQLLEKARSGRIDVYFAGDSITRRWGATDYPELLAHWRQTFFGWNAANFGWGGDTTHNILWRLENGELDGVNPKVIVLQAGTNNLARVTAADDRTAVAGDVARGILAILNVVRARAPSATIIVTGLFPRGDRVELNPIIADINRRVAAFADGRSIRFLDISDRLADASGTPAADLMRDGLHPTREGYQVWADALAPLLTTLLGPRASTDAAPPPTGDPSAPAGQPVK